MDGKDFLGSRRLLASAFALLVLVVAGFSPGSRVVLASSHSSQTPCIFNQTILTSPASTCRPHAITYPKKIKGSVKRGIYNGALTFGVPYSTLLVIAKCESGLNPRANNGTYFGLFQFAPATFSQGAKLMRKLTGVVAKSIWKPLDSSYVAGFLFAMRHDTSWTCLSAVGTHDVHSLAFQGRPNGEVLP